MIAKLGDQAGCNIGFLRGLRIETVAGLGPRLTLGQFGRQTKQHVVFDGNVWLGRRVGRCR